MKIGNLPLKDISTVEEVDLADRIAESNQQIKVSVLFYIFIFAILCNAQEPIRLIGEGEYNINVLKEIKGTDSFLSLGKDARECHTEANE